MVLSEIKTVSCTSQNIKETFDSGRNRECGVVTAGENESLNVAHQNSKAIKSGFLWEMNPEPIHPSLSKASVSRAPSKTGSGLCGAPSADTMPHSSPVVFAAQLSRGFLSGFPFFIPQPPQNTRRCGGPFRSSSLLKYCGSPNVLFGVGRDWIEDDSALMRGWVAEHHSHTQRAG